jgi:hypothetical protein
MADLTTLLSKFLDSLYFTNGRASGILTTSTTTAATAANTDETDLWTYSLPANTLSVDGKGLRLTIWGTTGATANNKTLKVYFGATTVLNQTTAVNAQRWRLDVTILRTAAATEEVLAGGIAQTSIFAQALTSGSIDLTAAVTIRMTGTNGTAAANDITFRGAVVEVLG